MSHRNQFHEIPEPESTSAGRNYVDKGDQRPSRMARLYKPRLTPPGEVDVSTVSRFAVRLIDRVTGKAYSAEEVLASAAAVALRIDAPQTLSPEQQAQGQSNLGLPKANYAATAPPSATDDSSAGYSVGSPWCDTVGNECYRCVDAAVGAAIWIESTFDGVEVAALIAVETAAREAADVLKANLAGAVFTGAISSTGTVTGANLVYTSGTQTIAGAKTFTSLPKSTGATAGDVTEVLTLGALQSSHGRSKRAILSIAQNGSGVVVHPFTFDQDDLMCEGISSYANQPMLLTICWQQASRCYYEFVIAPRPGGAGATPTKSFANFQPVLRYSTTDGLITVAVPNVGDGGYLVVNVTNNITGYASAEQMLLTLERLTTTNF